MRKPRRPHRSDSFPFAAPAICISGGGAVAVFPAIPKWIQEISPKTRELWAPDISYFDGLYHLYYAFSAFGKNTSGIALATNETLDSASPKYKWVDRGLVIRSYEKDDFNAIDPNLVLDAEGQAWLSLGSFWSGIKMIHLDRETGLQSKTDTKIYSLASRNASAVAVRNPDLPPDTEAVEAPFIVRHGGYYYLTVSWDLCCRGTKSTYRTMVGRSKQVTGPYLDRKGVPMMLDGGTSLLVANTLWLGPGGASVLRTPAGKTVRGPAGLPTPTARKTGILPCIYLPSPGRMGGPKRLWKAMAVRCWTASSEGISSLDKFGTEKLELWRFGKRLLNAAAQSSNGTFRSGARTMHLTATLRRITRACALLALATATLGLSSCSSGTPAGTAINLITSPLSVYNLVGDVGLIHDPSIIRQGANYYVLSTDGGQAGGFLPIFCSSDKVNWKRCSQIFTTIPASLTTALGSSVTSLWAPDVSFFNGLYHVYFVASVFGTNKSIIALATSPTMNPADPTYLWTYQGIVLQSPADGSGFNAIDPDILVDTDSMGNLLHVWMTYGSFFSGIAQREINPVTGQLLQAAATAPTLLATRPGVSGDPVEGPSLVKHNGFYYLFVSFDACCNSNFKTDTYKIAVGRSLSPQGPFTDMAGTSMLNGGGTILLQTTGEFTAPGGQDVLIDPTNGDLIAFHALSNTQNGYDYLFVKSLTWPSDWPVISN